MNNHDENCIEVVLDFFENQMSDSDLYKARRHLLEKEGKLKKEKDKNKLAKLTESIKLKEIELMGLRKSAPLTEVRYWLNSVTDKDNKKAPIKATHRVSKATHILKFSHPSAPHQSILVAEKSDDFLLTTSSLKKEPIQDLAHSDGALISVSRFLGLKLPEGRIIDLISSKRFEFFQNFSESEDEIENWNNVFSGLIRSAQIKSAHLAKQIYFPLKVEDEPGWNPSSYHLVVPLFSSSLAEEIHNKVSELKYGKNNKAIRDCITKGSNETSSYHPDEYYILPDMAEYHFGGDYPRNVSMLNANRSGNTYLFSSQPPIWKSQIKPPLHHKSWFDRGVPFNSIKGDVENLKNFFLRFDKTGQSTKDPIKQRWLIRWGRSVLSTVMYYAESIQNLPAGWSSDLDIKLKPEQQYFLDPYKMDGDFQTTKDASDWQSVVASDFAQWLNKKIQGKDKKFTPQTEHTKLWRVLMLEELREHRNMVKAVIAANKGGQA